MYNYIDIKLLKRKKNRTYNRTEQNISILDKNNRRVPQQGQLPGLARKHFSAFSEAGQLVYPGNSVSQGTLPSCNHALRLNGGEWVNDKEDFELIHVIRAMQAPSKLITSQHPKSKEVTLHDARKVEDYTVHRKPSHTV